MAEVFPLLLAPTKTVLSADNPTRVDNSFLKLAISTNSMRMARFAAWVIEEDYAPKSVDDYAQSVGLDFKPVVLASKLSYPQVVTI